MPAKKQPKKATEEQHYLPTEKELPAVRSYFKRATAEYVPSLRVVELEGIEKLVPDHPDEMIGWMLISESLGGVDVNLMTLLVHQIANASKQGGKISETEVNAVLAYVRSQKPRDGNEAMLLLQMSAVHSASMTFAQRLRNAENIPQQDSAERTFNKLTRTFTNQMNGLKRYRTGGEQKVTVQHVSVSEGGQAIVGNVTHGERKADESSAAREQPPAITDAKMKPMPAVGDASEGVKVGSPKKATTETDDK